MRCPHCNIENPSTANYCMSCGQVLNIAVVKNETSHLREEIKEQKRANKVLSREKNELTTHAVALEKQLTVQTAEATRLHDEKTELERVLEYTLKQQYELQETLKQLQEKAKQPRKRLIAFWVVSIVLSVFTAMFGTKSYNLNSQNHTLKNEIATTRNDTLKPLQAEHVFTPQTYKAVVDKAYFYDDNFNRKDAYIYYGNEVKIIRIKGYFGYGVYTSSKGISLFGWMRLSDIKQSAFN